MERGRPRGPHASPRAAGPPARGRLPDTKYILFILRIFNIKILYSTLLSIFSRPGRLPRRPGLAVAEPSSLPAPNPPPLPANPALPRSCPRSCPRSARMPSRSVRAAASESGGRDRHRTCVCACVCVCVCVCGLPPGAGQRRGQHDGEPGGRDRRRRLHAHTRHGLSHTRARTCARAREAGHTLATHEKHAPTAAATHPPPHPSPHTHTALEASATVRSHDQLTSWLSS